MSLLERLGRKSENEELTKQSTERGLGAAKAGGLSSRLGLSSRMQRPVHTENMTLSAPSSPSMSQEQKKVKETVVDKEMLHDDLGGKEHIGLESSLKQELKNEPSLPLRTGLGSRLISAISSTHSINQQEMSLPSGISLQERGVTGEKQSAVEEQKKKIFAQHEYSLALGHGKETMGLEKEGKNKPGIVTGLGLSTKLGMGQHGGLGARLNKNLDSVNSGLTSMGKTSNLKMGSVKVSAPDQDSYQNLKMEIHRQIIEELSIEQQKIIANSSSDRSELEHIVVELCNRVIDGDNPMAISRADRANIVKDIVDEVLGLGPIESLLKDETVSEVMINGPEMVYVERKGKLTLTNVRFQGEAHLMNIIERIVAPLGRRIDESSPLVDARLPDGSRVNIIIPPLALNGGCVTIRKFAKDPLTINNLIGFGSLNEDMASLIKSCVLGRLNIVVSGGTGSGKTTTLNVLSSFIPEDERIVTIEDAAELQLRQDHVVTLESRPANVEGNGQISIRDLVRNSLRMRPDRIVVGECRSGEALDMLQAMNTGHDGSLTTAHANSPRDVISRLETMVLMAGMDLPVRAIREQIASAVDLIIQQSRLRDGSRKITYITEVQGMEGDVIVLQDLFRFEQAGLDENGKLKGEFRTSGIRPKFLEKLEMNGIKVDGNMFLDARGWDE